MVTVSVSFDNVPHEEEDEEEYSGDGVGGGCGDFPLTGGSHTRFKREQNSNWLLCWPASLGLVSTRGTTGKYLFPYCLA